MTSVFASHIEKAYAHKFEGSLRVGMIAGGIPGDPNKVEGWLRSKFATSSDEFIMDLVAQTVQERGITRDEALEVVARDQHLNGFKRNGNGLYIDGRQLKAAIKEAGSIAVGAGKLKSRGWGTTNKGIRSFLAEHVFVLEDELPLHEAENGLEGAEKGEPTEIVQRFVHTFRGNGIQYEEVVRNARIDFSLVTDQEMTEEEWAMLWLTSEQNGIGASRSQGYGRFEVERWEAVR